MRKLILNFMTALLTSQVSAAAVDDVTANRIADAIWQAEGGEKTRYPYGIKSVKVSSATEARNTCINTIKNTYRRWLGSGSRGHFIDALADRYCPPSADPKGNRNWKRNVRRILGCS